MPPLTKSRHGLVVTLTMEFEMWGCGMDLEFLPLAKSSPRVIHPEVKLNLSFVGALCVWMSKLFVFPPQLMTLEE